MKMRDEMSASQQGDSMHTDRTYSKGMGQTIGGMVVVALASCIGLWHPSQAAEFTCVGGDVDCLIDAIQTANANGEENTITLEAGTYTLAVVDNTTNGPNGLPSVISAFPLTVRGAGAESTIIERAASAPAFRLVHVAATGTLTLKELTLQGGRVSGAGGGIFNSIGGTLTLTNCTLSGNSTTVFGVGGGIENGGTLTLTNCTLSGNSAIDGGGGIRNFRSLTLINSILSGNSATDGIGGGIYNFFGASTIINSTLSGNSATGFGSGVGGGGGIHNSDATLTLINSTLSGNSATGFGGGIYNTNVGATALQNTIVALNTADTAGPDCSNRIGSGSVTSQGHNLVGDPTDCTFTLLPSDLTGDPGLDAFADDGTPGNGHFPLLFTSQAINAGNDAACPPTDQLGQPRVGRCDIGAIEFQPALTSCMGTGAARVRGRVRAADLTGIGEVLVTLTGPAGCRDRVTTNAQGHYVFRTLGPGTYTVTVTKDACTFIPAERTETLEASPVRARFRGTCP
jgi:Carboxypeptidase regulatory-like domain